MANTIVSLTIPEADVARTKAAAEAFTGLTIQRNEKNEVTFTPTAKELLAAVAKQVVLRWEAETHAFTPPGIT